MNIESFSLVFEKKDIQYRKDFISKFIRIVSKSKILCVNFFDPLLDEQIYTFLKNHPDITLEILIESPVKEEETIFCKRLAKFKELQQVTITSAFDLLVALQNCMLNPIEEYHLFFPQAIEEKMEKELISVFKKKKALFDLLKKNIYESIALEHLFKNFAGNLLHLDHSFLLHRRSNALRGLPAIICGNGPSLIEHTSWLKEVVKKAVIFSCGSAITTMSKLQIEPHFLVATCPRQTEINSLKGNRYLDTPLLFSTRLHHQCHQFFQGAKGVFLHEDLGLEAKLFHDGKNFKKKRVDFETVAGFAIEKALFLGCNPIILVGVDLSVDPASATQSIEKIVVRKGSHQKRVHTIQSFANEALAIGKLAEKRPDLSFYSLSKTGVFIPNIKYENHQYLDENILTKNFDIFRFRQDLIQSDQDLDEKKKIHDQLYQIKDSLQKVQDLAQIMIFQIEEKMSVYDFRLYEVHQSLQDEIAYQKLIYPQLCGLSYFNPAMMADRVIGEEEKFKEHLKFISAIVPRYLSVFKEPPLC